MLIPKMVMWVLPGIVEVDAFGIVRKEPTEIKNCIVSIFLYCLSLTHITLCYILSLLSCQLF